MKQKLHEEISRSGPINVTCSQRWVVFAAVILFVAIGLIVVATDEASAQENINREILPVVPPEPATYSELDTKNTEPPVPLTVGQPARVSTSFMVL